jgi:hypothetical protein
LANGDSVPGVDAGFFHALFQPDGIQLVVNSQHLSVAVEEHGRVESPSTLLSINRADNVRSMLLSQTSNGGDCGAVERFLTRLVLASKSLGKRLSRFRAHLRCPPEPRSPPGDGLA